MIVFFISSITSVRTSFAAGLPMILPIVQSKESHALSSSVTCALHFGFDKILSSTVPTQKSPITSFKNPTLSCTQFGILSQNALSLVWIAVSPTENPCGPNA